MEATDQSAPETLFGGSREEVTYPKAYLKWYAAFCISIVLVYMGTLETERGSTEWRDNVSSILDRWQSSLERGTLTSRSPAKDVRARDQFWRLLHGTVFVGVHVPLAAAAKGNSSSSAGEQLRLVQDSIDSTLARLKTALCEQAAQTDEDAECPLNFAVNYFSEFITSQSLEAERESKTFARDGTPKRSNPQKELALRLRAHGVRMGDDLMPAGISTASTSSTAVSPLQLLVALSPQMADGGADGDTPGLSGCAWMEALSGDAMADRNLASMRMVCLVDTPAAAKQTIGSGLAEAFQVPNFKPASKGFLGAESGTIRNYKLKAISTLGKFLRTTAQHGEIPVPQTIQSLVEGIVCRAFWTEVLPSLEQVEADPVHLAVPPNCETYDTLIREGNSDRGSTWLPAQLTTILQLLSGIESDTVTDAQVLGMLKQGGRSSYSVQLQLWRQIVDTADALTQSPLLLPQAQMPMEQALATVAPLFVPMLLAVVGDSLKLFKKERRERR